MGSDSIIFCVMAARMDFIVSAMTGAAFEISSHVEVGAVII